MKLVSVQIERFRGIRESVIRVGSELALVGQNSGGKSSILRALNAFFNFEDERVSFESGRHSFQKTATAVIQVSFSDVPSACNLPRISFGSSDIRVRLRYKRTPSWQIWSDGAWKTAPTDLHTELSKYIRYVYVPLRRDHEVSRWGTGGLLQKAVEAWLEHHTSRRDSISPKVSEVTKSIKNRAFNGLSKQLRKITPMHGSFTFDLEYCRQPDYRMLLRELTLRVREGGITVDLEDCGSGTQSMTALALYSYLAELVGSTYIFGIEEPEQNLHPQAQRELLANLRRLPLQILFTTHSPVMLDELCHEDVVLCRRLLSSARGVEIETSQLDKAFWTEKRLDQERYYQFHRRKNSDLFFANFVILTEGSVDSEIISFLLRKAGIEKAKHGVSVIALDGVTSLPYAYHLLRALNLEFATIVDKDYFMPYLNDTLEADLLKGKVGSRDARGFPRYKKIYKTDTLLASMVPNATDRENLLRLFHSNHSRAMNILEKSNVFCFRWSLEIDLVNSTNARDLFFDHLRVPAAARNPSTLLVDMAQAIKKLETLYTVINGLEPSNLPNSYKRLRKMLPELVKKAGRRP